MNNNKNTGIVVKFWGTRGTLPAPGKSFLKAGGNTNCVEIECGDHLIIVDAGTGIRQLGSRIVSEDTGKKVHLLLTHAHYDHIEGLPFFAPFFDPGRSVDVYCGELDGGEGTKHTVLNLMRRPYFPVGPEVFTADVAYNNIISGDEFSLGDGIQVRTCALNHPGGATAYRIDFEGSSFAVVTDTEHVPGKHDDTVLELIDGIDRFAYDCSLIDIEMPEFEGYGHSSHEEAIRLAKLAGAGGVLATHHMPFRTDDDLAVIERELFDSLPNSGIAREGDTVHIG